LCTEFVSSFFAGSFTQSLAKENCEGRFQGQFQPEQPCDLTSTVEGYCQIEEFQDSPGATVYRYFYMDLYSRESAKTACETSDLGRGTWIER
jgi:hypothetical protein